MAALVATTTVFSVEVGAAVAPAAVVTALAAPLPVSEPGHMDGTTYMVAVMAVAASMFEVKCPGRWRCRRQGRH